MTAEYSRQQTLNAPVEFLSVVSVTLVSRAIYIFSLNVSVILIALSHVLPSSSAPESS